MQGGINFTVARTRAGALYAWGGNQYGQLGDGSVAHRWHPTRVQLPHGARAAQIAVGLDHVLTLTETGDVFGWGRNHRGQAGSGSGHDEHRPIRIALRGVGAVRSLAAGDATSALITRDGDLMVWGRNSYGQLGVKGDDAAVSAEPRLAHARPAPSVLPAEGGAVAVALGRHHVAVALEDARILVRGLDPAGVVGEQTFTLPAGVGRPAQLCAGADYTLVRTSRGKLLGFGGNASGQVGVGDRVCRLRPSPIELPGAYGRVVDVWAGARSAAAVTSSGQVYTWGDGNLGQHGSGAAASVRGILVSPREVDALGSTHVRSVSGGAHHLLVMVPSGGPVSLRIDLQRRTAQAKEVIGYRVFTVDVFGNDLDEADGATVSVADGRVTEQGVVGNTPGLHHVSARWARLTAVSTFNVETKDR